MYKPSNSAKSVLCNTSSSKKTNKQTSKLNKTKICSNTEKRKPFSQQNLSFLLLSKRHGGIHSAGFYAPRVRYYQGQPKGKDIYQSEFKTNQGKTI